MARANIWVPSSLVSLSQYSNETLSYGEFRNSIKKNYISNCAPFLTSWLGIFAASIFLIKMETPSGSAAFLWVALGVMVLVPLIHRLLLLVHEGAHLHFSQSRKVNDLITNVFAGVFLASEVSTYRKVHTLHHRQIGKEDDPENSYVNEFDFSWIATAVSGVYTIKTIVKRRSRVSSRRQSLLMLATIVLHSFTVVVSVSNGHLLFALTWILSWFVFLPVMAATRNLLEHRYTESEMHFEIQESIVGFSNVTTRLFTRNLLSKVVGPIGFDRHVIHHWDPSIAAKDLDKVHQFLLSTELRPMLEDLPTTYFDAARHIWRSKNEPMSSL